tara:strand:+ start:701 stop:1525 length:825 start_codon:yes stop_codon:yes gene_type:complete
MCKAFKVSRSGYYEWLRRKPSYRCLERQQIIQAIQMIHQESNGRYGSPKITSELTDRGWIVSRPRVARIMRCEGIRSITCKKFRGTTTDIKHDYPVAENILDRNFEASSPGQKWVSDITYIPTWQGWMYLTIIMDLFDRKIVGWSLGTTLTTQDTVLAAWRRAIINRPINDRLIFHSDRGVQYASYAFTEEIEKHDVVQSMSRKANCWDNAVAENFFKILKSEMIRHTAFHSILEARNEVFRFIEVWYNRKRKHSYLGYKTPEQYGKINYSKCA